MTFPIHLPAVLAAISIALAAVNLTIKIEGQSASRLNSLAVVVLAAAFILDRVLS